ncbi:transglutaminase TgpA family protein [Azomonas macrocytogenes]|uniref:Transglutaminase-like putative cysteine protease n=1 Tax=Azomonas macrocytogenes TaxID=69962 RepID=A0A839T4F9_AZOMA|nr:DUF3488 and transglutaminase-like domain-containing protein [Azomonas macrocytogenes]MBB3104421.1 transglutaminase-like putative cysteine protease [Azomonas macrocytogenes]
MKAAEVIPRNSLFWLLIVQFLVILPHLQYLPPWIIVLWLGCTWWRLRIFRMCAAYPNGWVKALLMLSTGLAIYVSHGTLIGLDAGAVLLMTAFILKTLEMRNRRDALIVIFLGFFAVVTGYLFDSGVLAAVYSLLPITALLAGMIGLYQNDSAGYRAPLRLAGSLLLQALPLMLVLFVFFPRLAPLWGMPQPAEQAVSGLAESMSPGEMVELSQSSELAFRVTFDGQLPAHENLYWRAITFERFDGQRWARSSNSYLAQEPKWEPQGEPLSYNIIIQPNGRSWLFSLDVPKIQADDARMMADFHLERRRPVDRALMYRTVSWPDSRREPSATSASLAASLQLPRQGNPRTRIWAEELRRSEPDPERLVQVLLRHFNQQPYVYTLKPLPVGENIVDDFLFQTRSGFCIHYAGAMTFILRAAGIPARVVGGYQGGELNPAGNYLSIHQFDAHAWVEYWLPERGWISIDPTFQVAPERIRTGLQQAMVQEQSFLEGDPLALHRYSGINWLNELRMAWDNVNYGWQRWVLNYQGDEQKQILQKWLGSFELRWDWLGIGLVLVLAVLSGSLALLLFKPWRSTPDLVQRLFLRYEKLLAGQGIVRQKHEGARAFAERAAQVLPDQAQAIRQFTGIYECTRYSGEPASPREMQQAFKALRDALFSRNHAKDRIH